MTISQTDLAYAAGIIDGEGCITIQRARKSERYIAYVLQVVVGISDKSIIEWLAARFGGNVHCAKPRKSKFGPFVVNGAKDSWNWNIVAVQAENFLRAILPYLKGKRKQAILGLRFRRTAIPTGKRLTTKHYKVREAMYWRMRELKRL